MRLIPRLVPSFALAFVVGCDDAGAIDDGAALETDDVADLSDGATASGPDWSCLPDPQRPAPSAPSLDFPLRTRSALDGSPVAGMEIKVCAGMDLACPTVVDTEMTDADGLASVSIPTVDGGFVGFALITGADYVDTIALANVPIVSARSMPVDLDVVRTNELAAIAAALDAVDPARGHVVVATWDCALMPAAGVALALAEADGGSTRFYVEGALPSRAATETDARGGGGFLNVPVGDAHVTATRASDGTAIGTATVPVVAGKITNVVIVPN